MMNEVLFFVHIILILGFLGIAVRLGRQALAVYVALSSVLANLFVVKQMTFFGLEVTCSDVYAVAGILGLNLLQELYGRDASKQAVKTSLFGLALFVLMSQIHLLYAPSSFDTAQPSFQRILGQTPRICAASVAVYYFVQRVDVLFFAFLQKAIRPFGARLMLSLVVSQALDTVLFSFLGLYGLVSSIFDIIVVSFTVKCAIIACSGPIAAFVKKRVIA